MAVVVVSSAPSRAQYEAVSKAVDLSSKPAGQILHAAAEMANGEVQIVDVWESQQAAETFRDERLFPAFQKAGMLEMVQAAPPPTMLEAFELLR